MPETAASCLPNQQSICPKSTGHRFRAKRVRKSFLLLSAATGNVGSRKASIIPFSFFDHSFLLLLSFLPLYLYPCALSFILARPLPARSVTALSCECGGEVILALPESGFPCGQNYWSRLLLADFVSHTKLSEASAVWTSSIVSYSRAATGGALVSTLPHAFRSQHTVRGNEMQC
jgi:hypothetical protein